MSVVGAACGNRTRVFSLEGIGVTNFIHIFAWVKIAKK